MANNKSKIKTGMGGSSSGRSRSEHTDVLKSQSKKQRRIVDKELVKNEEESFN